MKNIRQILIIVMLPFFSIWAQSSIQINGAGATFPYPLYSKWFSEYQKKNDKLQINYQSIGSGGGIQQFLKRTVDFGASDAPVSDEQLAKADKPVLHVPTALGAVVLTYNLPGQNGTLKMSGEIIADIYLGKITKWNDFKLAKLNPEMKLPDQAIIVVRRSDGSGTSNIFTDYLAKVSAEWKEKVGVGSSVSWPVGIGGKGNEGVMGLVKQTPMSIGYTELVYALNNKMPVAQVKNKAGNFVTPSTKSVTAAAADNKNMPEDFRVSITNAEGKDSYPISSFTYLLVYGELSGPTGNGIVQFLEWAIHDGQSHSEPLGYAKLPTNLVKKIETKIKKIKVL